MVVPARHVTSAALPHRQVSSAAARLAINVLGRGKSSCFTHGIDM